jgi:DNA-directed RNA polymerase subunit alpha
MLQIQCLKSTCNKPTELYSKSSIGPFIKGQSITIGNTLRRVLLSNLQGLAITGVHIKGTAHEFSSIPNVKEDVIDILLNLKQIILKGNITEPVLARISTEEAGIIVASDIAFPNNITVVDPNQYIMSLTNKESLEMELLIAKGQSYLISEKLKCTIPRNFLAIDAVFMPVSKVNFFVQPSSNNSLPDFESLILEI